MLNQREKQIAYSLQKARLDNYVHTELASDEDPAKNPNIRNSNIYT